jgi:hypothetical protein
MVRTEARSRWKMPLGLTPSCVPSAVDFVSDATGACVPAPERPDLWAEPAGCPAGTPYYIQSGYTLVPDDACLVDQQDWAAPLRRICTGSGIPTVPPTTPPAGTILSRVVREPWLFGRGAGTPCATTTKRRVCGAPQTVIAAVSDEDEPTTVVTQAASDVRAHACVLG